MIHAQRIAVAFPALATSPAWAAHAYRRVYWYAEHGGRLYGPLEERWLAESVGRNVAGVEIRACVTDDEGRRVWIPREEIARAGESPAVMAVVGRSL